MDFWTQFAAQFWGSLLASALIVPIALWAENWLDERSRKKHDHHG